jgi:hypothetical protein
MGFRRDGFWLLVVLLFSSGCAGLLIEAGKSDLPESVRALIAQKYGESALPGKDQFAPLKPLQGLYGHFVPYYADATLKADGHGIGLCRTSFPPGEGSPCDRAGNGGGGVRLA